MADIGPFAFVLIGALAGWLAGKLTRGKGFGLVANVLIGVLGALLGGFLFRLADVNVGGGFWASLLVALVGALVLVGAAQLVRGR